MKKNLIILIALLISRVQGFAQTETWIIPGNVKYIRIYYNGDELNGGSCMDQSGIDLGGGDAISEVIPTASGIVPGTNLYNFTYGGDLIYQEAVEGSCIGDNCGGAIYSVYPNTTVQKYLQLVRYDIVNGVRCYKLQDGFIGKINLRYWYRKEWHDFPWQPCQYSYHYKDVVVCRLAPNNGIIAGSVQSYPGNRITPDALGKAKFNFQWTLDPSIDYCMNTITSMAIRKSGSTASLDFQPVTLSTDGRTLSSPIQLEETQQGTHTYQVYLMDQYGSVFGPYTKSISVVAPCYGVSDLLVSFSGTTLPTTVLGGYGTNAGGYQLDKNTTYQLVLSIPSGQANFDNLYNVFFDGAVITNGVLSNPKVSISKQGSYFNIQLKEDIGSYDITVRPKNAADFNSCPELQPLHLFVGGSNLEVSRNCLILLPDDIPSLFPSLKDWGQNYFLSHFNFTIKSSQGIVLSPGNSGGLTLTAGATVQLLPEPPNPADAELVDNNKNWVLTRVYAENGFVISESKAFYNEKGAPTQSQSKNFTSGVVLASQVVYDKFERPAITTLPAPVLGTSATSAVNDCGDRIQAGQDLYFLHKDNFITYLNQSYKYTNFDDYIYLGVGPVSKFSIPSPVDGTTPGTLGWYYSNNNVPNSSLSFDQAHFVEPFTPSTAYPYSRTIYKDDGSNDVIGTTLPGDYHKAGSNKYTTFDESMVSATDANVVKYLSMRATALPGLTAPANLSDKASVRQVTDSEGKVSKSYVSQSGKVLITVGPTNDLAFNFYNELGQLVYSVSPNGVRDYFATPTVPFALIDKTSYRYNSKGQVIEQTESDVGATKFMYRKDGALRFAQNAEQLKNGRFSYTDYDMMGRVIETGEYTPCLGCTLTTSACTSCSLAFNSTGLKALLENTGASDGLISTQGYKSDRILTSYDSKDVASPISQEFLHGAVSYTEKPGVSKTWYSYDAQGRIIQLAKSITGLPLQTINYTYGANGGVTEITYQKEPDDYPFTHWYEYDEDGRLAKAYSGSSGSEKTLNAKYEYYLHGPLKRTEIGAGLQGIDYTYTPQGWLKSINNPANLTDGKAGFALDAFAMNLDYFNNDYIKAGSNISSINYGNTQYYNGQIRGTSWRTQDAGNPVGYKYNYDGKYQLTDAIFGASDFTTNIFTASSSFQFSETGIAYDPNGNMRSLLRKRLNGTVYHDFTNNKFSYVANTNKISSITGYASYHYNAAGQMDEQTFINGTRKVVRYDAYDKVTDVLDENNNNDVKFVYDDQGHRIKKLTYNIVGTLSSTTYYVRDASGNLLRTYLDAGMANGPELKETFIYGSDKIGMAEYYLDNGGFGYDYSYEIKDNLGNVRVVFDDQKSSGKVALFRWVDFYPYGLEIPTNERGLAGFNYKFGYQGQFSEKDPETGWNAFELRMYDPVVGRWFGPDPMRQYYSTYLGMGNNPVNAIDPTGGEVDDIIFQNNEGEEIARIKTNDENDVYIRTNWGIKLPAPIVVDIRDRQNDIDAVGIGIDLSMTAGGGINGGWDIVYFLQGPEAGTYSKYKRIGGNIGWEMTGGITVFTAWIADGHVPTSDSWSGVANSYSGGAGVLGSGYFWSNKRNTPEFKPGSFIGGEKIWEGYTYTGTVPIPMGTKIGVKWGFSNAWKIGQ